MPNFSEESKAKLATCHPYLRKLFEEVIKTQDCTIICGERNKADQDKAVAEGNSQTPYPTSKHNSSPSMAVDVAPYPIDWKDIGRFQHFAGYVQAVADRMNISVTWGGSWVPFKDYPHWQLNQEAMRESNSLI